MSREILGEMCFEILKRDYRIEIENISKLGLNSSKQGDNSYVYQVIYKFFYFFIQTIESIMHILKVNKQVSIRTRRRRNERQRR